MNLISFPYSSGAFGKQFLKFVYFLLHRDTLCVRLNIILIIIFHNIYIDVLCFSLYTQGTK